MHKLYLASLIFCILAWTYRFYSLFKISAFGMLQDFRVYYLASRTIIEGVPNADIIVKSSFGPPFTVLGFLPFSFFSYSFDQIFITVVNILCFAVVFFGLWKRWYGAITSFFLFFLSITAFCFPVIFSLGMGNPIGILTLGIYIFWLSKNILLQWIFFSTAVVLKLFPLVILPVVFVSVHKNSLSFKTQQIKAAGIALCAVTLLSLILFPTEVWSLYSTYSQERHFTVPDPVVYNQSFSSTLARFKVLVSSFSPVYWIFSIVLLSSVVVYILNNKNSIFSYKNSLDGAILLLCTALLLHPFPWQHYFAIFIPFLMLEIKKYSVFPTIIFILVSFDGGKIGASGLMGILLNSSQFLATLLLFIYILRKPNASTKNEDE